jgi:N-acetylneuraminic acid mutarotase
MLPGILFGCLFAFATIVMSAGAQTTAPNEWTWLSGSSSVQAPCDTCAGQPGVYGTLGSPAAGNTPGGRDSAATWTDKNGNFWLFGGEGADANGNFGQLNDLWEFQPSTQLWTWMGGNSTLPSSCAANGLSVNCGQPGVYGTLGSPAAANIPGGRSVSSFGTDSSGNFWLFAGGGFDADQQFGSLNDVWKFDPISKEWTWMGGSSTIGSNGGQPGVYGTLGSAAAANIPGGRDFATSWVGQEGQLWIYGGDGLDSQGNYGQLDDLWKLDTAANQWTWVSGSSTLPAACATDSSNQGNCGWPADYGQLQVAAPDNSPGSRVGAAGWIDKNGNLWLFGGIGSVFTLSLDFSEIDQYDLWEFNTSTQLWAWMSGNSSLNCGASSKPLWCEAESGNNGVLGIPAVGNIPASRDNAATWTDANGNLWLFGGSQTFEIGLGGNGLFCNDIWVYESASNEWAWMNGSTAGSEVEPCASQMGTVGVLGIPAALNSPAARLGTAHWTDSSGNFWVFGGLYEGPIGIDDLNDLWVYKPAAPAPQPSFEANAYPNPVNIAAIGASTPITTGTTTVSIITAGGFDSPVTLTAQSAGLCDYDPCISGSFSPAVITGSGSSTLTFSVNGAAYDLPSVYAFSITATSGSVSQSLSVEVEVTGVGQFSGPSFSIPAGTYPTTQTVAITDSALAPNEYEYIYYTLDGTTPNESSAVYVSPIEISSTTTLKAIAIAGGTIQSAVTTATYTIPPFSLTGTSVNLAPGATTANTSLITVTPSSAFTGTVALSCSITPQAASDPATCSIPASVTISGSAAQTTTLTVNTTAATSASNQTKPSFGPWAGVTTLACLIFVGIPVRRRRSQNILGILVLLFSIVGGALGCGGGGNSGGGGGNSGTTPGTYVITVTGTSGAITEKTTLPLTVQ